MTTLQQSLAECRRITHRSGSSFRFAFRVLPPDQREAMNVVYAYFRLSDDLGDDATLGTIDERRTRLAEWRTGLERCLAGEPSHAIHPALHWAVNAHGIPPRYLREVLDGVESDLNGDPIRTFEDLKQYCYRVASTVGLCCIRVWGLKPGVAWEQAEPLAIDAGYAFQLTNILRDLREDAERGRVYLPANELARFGVSPGNWAEPDQRERFRELLRFQIERAKAYYERSAALKPLLSPGGRAIHGLMHRAYEGLLTRISASDCGVLSRRIRLGRRAKLMLLARALLS